jgi:ribosomal protein S18 acetylase RimI-like enzyme
MVTVTPKRDTCAQGEEALQMKRKQVMTVIRHRMASSGLAHVVIPVHPDMDVTAEIWALVVSSDQRGDRIGQRLLASAEVWAKVQGAESIRLHTNVLETDAHRFYERIGFEYIKTSRSYAKNL